MTEYFENHTILLSNDIYKALNHLDKRERTILINRYGLFGESRKTLEEIGQILGFSKERIRQIENQAIKKLREEKVNIPVIAWTADAIEGQEEKYISEGFDGYLSKPIDKTKLKVILNKYLKGE